MRIAKFQKSFKKDYKKACAQGKDISELDKAMALLLSEAPLPPKYRDHALTGDWSGCRELHLESDWLLIYKLYDDGVCGFARTGSHAELFGK